MKKSINAFAGGSGNSAGFLQLRGMFFWMKKAVLMTVFLTTWIFMGCQKDNGSLPADQEKLMSQHSMNTDQQFRTYYSGLDQQTTWELQQVRAATAKYRHIDKAIADGYASINVVRQNMGYHFMKSEYVDATFEVRRPEILVYEKLEDGSYRLVAVEYAVPIPLSPNVAPEGFSGSGDVWTYNTEFNLWLLHAWVWKNNPSGVFNPLNPLVIVDANDIQ